ncbi:DHH family phosphoesterase [Natronobacterium gregoryi]|uniref:Phosphoesterase RecJ domain-containing protein n=2 Tax=Natronobacterium gregoryi TaxID=44930 RepID=L0AFT4_NATGS|nr:DHH family phosphoesterase [Natronobacterium gregoryi]AFZ72666.1 single-stranded DNA-specific exonuclease [Natronobacterium gregoryi SP2]ELY69045.1 phosphoesterase RecJ domain-containing protein [Natronobacterium gregoryi SP2]PLK20620.1 recombinase RecJ [Natronobacterium gregoryi SP2]SFI91011.1 RecJ-like exonuclease [Natronobacterium gregoryi]
MAGPIPELEGRATRCARRLCEADRVLLASHIDADGLTSAAIAAQALERAGIPFETVFEKQLDEEAIAAIATTDYDTVCFTDFGSGQLDIIGEHEDAGDFTPVVADHHQPADRETEYHLNPLLFGIDGASELSGAGASYVLARALADISEPEVATDGGTASATARADNRDLAALAVVGAVGDMQASGGKLEGANEEIVEEGVEAGVLETGKDLTLYGKQTRPLPKLLEYATDVHIPGISNDQAGALQFLEDLDLELKRDGEWRRWSGLTNEEKRTVASALVKRAVSRGVPAKKIDNLVGTAYVLSEEPVGTELRDASEFSTLLNATARYERADVGLGVCLGNREGALERARTLLRNHRRNLSAGIDLVTREGVTHEEHIQWFHAGDRIRETIVGIVAGMAMGNDGVSRSKPIVAFAEKSDESEDGGEDVELKVSARGTHALVRNGLDLSVVMGEASRAVGGDGGGHDVAAGATVPKGRESEFLEHADEIAGEQLT